MAKKGRILITGGNGFIGSHLADKLSSEYEVYIFDKAENRIGYVPDATFLKGNVKSRDEVFGKFPGDLAGIVHLAAVSRVVDGEKDPAECMNTAVSGTMNVLDFVRQNKPWIILGSTNEVSHNNIYGLAKHTQELCVERYSKDYGVKSLVTKFASVYGSNRDQEKLIPILIRRARNGEEIVLNNGLREQDFINIQDIVEGISLGVEHMPNVQEGYFERVPLASGRTMKDGDLAREIIQELKSSSKLIIKAEIPDSFPRMDTRKAEEILGFKAEKRRWVY